MRWYVPVGSYRICPFDWKAVEAGEITEQRIDESVRRILKLKQSIRK